MPSFSLARSTSGPPSGRCPSSPSRPRRSRCSGRSRRPARTSASSWTSSARSPASWPWRTSPKKYWARSSPSARRRRSSSSRTARMSSWSSARPPSTRSTASWGATRRRGLARLGLPACSSTRSAPFQLPVPASRCPAAWRRKSSRRRSSASAESGWGRRPGLRTAPQVHGDQLDPSRLDLLKGRVADPGRQSSIHGRPRDSRRLHRGAAVESRRPAGVRRLRGPERGIRKSHAPVRAGRVALAGDDRARASDRSSSRASSPGAPQPRTPARTSGRNSSHSS